jgi:uncharacterized protein (TIGR02145 family)
VPNDAEWETLITFLGGDQVAGGAMKETGIIHWIAPNTGATNSSGFTGLPGGFRGSDGSSSYIGYGGGWWSANQGSLTDGWIYNLGNNDAAINKAGFSKNSGISVRCISD